MKETAQQYTERMLGNVGDQTPLQIQAATPKKLGRMLKGVSGAKLRKRPAPGKWSIAEILAHIADTELMVGCRVRLILGAPGTPLQPFDQDAWAVAMQYSKRNPKSSLEQFRNIRATNLALLKLLSPEQWKQYGMHAERGQESIEKIVRMTAGHDVNHVGQIERILNSGKKR